MKACEKCEALPELIEGDKKLYMWPPLGHTANKIKKTVCKYLNCDSEGNAIVIRLNSEDFILFLKEMDQVLSLGEKNDTHCLLHAGAQAPTLDDFQNIHSLRKIIALYCEDWLRNVFDDGRLLSSFQPIISTQNPSLPFAHECLLRLKEKDHVSGPGPIFQKAREADMLFQLDRTAREVHIRNAAKQQTDGKFFINFTPTSIYDPKNCLKTTFKIIKEVGLKPDQIVFEVIETEKVDDIDHLKNVLAAYQNEGFEVALDDLGAGHATLNMLGDLRPDYVKLDMDLARDVHKDSFKSEMLKWIISLAHKFDIKVIAEGIECAEEAAWLTSQRTDFMQGFHFAKPDQNTVHFIERRQKRPDALSA